VVFFMNRARILGGVALVAAATLLAVAGARRALRSMALASQREETPHPAWIQATQAPLARYEAAVALVGGKVYIFGGFVPPRIQATARIDVYDPASRTWTRKQDMPLAVTHANAAVIQDTVWLAGGFVGNSPGPATDKVYRYDPQHDSWSQGPSLPEPRAGGALTNLDGTLHYFGGWKADRNTDSGAHWVLERGASRWQSASPLPHPRGHLGGLALGGRVYAVGGCVGHDPVPLDVNFVHRYDPATDRWEEVAPLPVPRSHIEPSTFVHRGRMVVIGGRSRPSGWRILPDVTEYDPATNSWTALPSLPIPLLAPVAVAIGDSVLVGAGSETDSNPENLRFWMGTPWTGWVPGDSLPSAIGEVAGGIIGNRLYLVGAHNPATLVLDLATGHWAPRDQLAMRPSIRDALSAEVLGGELYLLGGVGPRGGLVQIYNPTDDSWRIGPATPLRGSFSASAVIEDRIYVAGGMVGDTATAQAAAFDPATAQWKRLAPMPHPVGRAVAGTDGKRFYVFGGVSRSSGARDSAAGVVQTLQIYDPASDTWIASGGGPGSPAPLPLARARAGKAPFYRGAFYLFGGVTSSRPAATPDGTSARVDIFDPVANAWRQGPDMPAPRWGIFPLTYGDRIYVAGGGRPGGPPASTVVEIFVPQP
jgi:N-acetylneuraminic acid mutarotase